MGDYQPSYGPPREAVTRATSAAVIGGRLITAAGAHAGADSKTWLGVAAKDTPSGETVTVFCGNVQGLVAAGAIAASTPVKCAADGKVTTYVPGTDDPEEQVGLTLEAATAADDVIDVKMTR